MNARLAAAACHFLDVPFRLHGRDPATGLDCVGLVAAALERCGHPVTPPQGYTLRSLDLAPLLQSAGQSGLTEVRQNGDIVLAAVHSLQPHLLMAAPDGFVHAHAGVGRVTFLPGPLPWPILRQWRLLENKD